MALFKHLKKLSAHQIGRIESTAKPEF